MPVRSIKTHERPADAFSRQTGLHMTIFGDIDLVVKIHETAAHDRQIDHQRGKREQQGDEARS